MSTYHRARLSLLLAAFACVASAPLRAEFVRGDINGWTTNNGTMTSDTSFGNIFKVTIRANTNAATAQFKFDRTGDWSTNWGSGTGSTNATKNSTMGFARFDGGSMGNLNYSGQTANNYYSFNLGGQSDWWDREYVIMETQNTPVTIPAVTFSALASTGAVPVSVKSSATPGAGERIWVRFSTNNFSASTLLPSTGSGTNYTVNLPARSSGTRAYFYVLTSTMPSNVITANYDLNTLRGNNNANANYTFRYGTMNAWHFPTNQEPGTAFMRNPPTNGVPSSTAVYFYSGSQTGGVGNAANQTSMQLIHRLKGSGTWVTNSGAFDSGTEFNQYWQSVITGNTYAAGSEVEYYLRVTASDHNTTFIGTTNSGVGNVLFLDEAGARAAPFSFSYGAFVYNLGNAWHVPAVAEPPGAYMRNPRNPYPNNDVFVYNGNQFQGEGNAADQSGGWLFHRLAGAGAWSSNALTFDSQLENNKYWYGVIPAGTYSATNEVEYYLRIDYNDRDTTYLATTNGGNVSVPYGLAATAQANPFRFTYGGAPGTEAGFMWHNSNRVVVAENTVEFWVKIGYSDGSGNDRWVDHAVLYYTTNGQSAVATGKGTGDVNTLTAAMSFSHVEQDVSANGNAMWWRVTVGDLPATGTVRYRIGAWKGDGAQRFAEYNTEGEDNKEFTFSLYTPGAEGLQVNGRNADYATTKFFVDERAGDMHTVNVVYVIPGSDPVTQVEVFSNLDRRDYADVDINSDGIPDGIKPPLGDTITTNDTGAYFRAYPMTLFAGREYRWTGTASKSGAYRLTARYKVSGNTNWFWYSSEGRRDHAIVVSPKKALEMTLYEVNPLTVKATMNDFNGRSTFADLLEGDQDSFTNFNLGYLNKIQVNALWFQPIHPSAVTTRGDPSGYDPGSPYATRDYFAVAPVMGSDNTEAGAMAEFTNFVYRCDTYTGSVGSVHIMLDGVFNHTAWDAVMGQGGVDLGFASSTTNSMPGTKPGWYSYWQDYGSPATFYNGVYDNDIAVAPDRGDFGKWEDTADLFFGRYSALVRNNPEKNGDYLNEDDVYDFAGMSTDTVQLWKYFAYYTEFWLKKTGHPTNNLSAAADDLGIDALRCDFGQGLPPQLWEYLINRTRKMKWNFVFMAETLDGGVPGYRSNRHFDILNESIVFRFTQEKVNQSWDLRTAIEDRRTAYNSGAILLNLTGHDEVMPDNDPWVVASRYGAVSTVDGLPMIFYGQEQGIQQFNPADPDNKNDGFLHSHELNFGKYIPHFKQWNKLTVWEQPPDFSDGLPQWYGRVNWARLNSPALRSQNRYFLSKVGGGEEGSIFAVAKYETPGGSPASNDVVLAFSLFLRHGESHFGAGATYDLQGPWNLLGLDTGKTYRVRNLASSDAGAYITNGWPRTGQDLWDNGIYVYLGGGTGPESITDDGQLVQYLKIEEAKPDPDSNDNGIPDEWELFYFSSLTNSASGDYDGDGFSNYDEYIANTHPTNGASFFQLLGAMSASTGRVVTVATEPDRKYTIYFADALSNGMTWATFANPANGIGTWRETNTSSSSRNFIDDEGLDTSGSAPAKGLRFYRFEVELP